MCGIIGVIGEDAWNEAIRQLQRLVYRGYDSWGVGTLENGVQVYKKIGNIQNASSNGPGVSTAIGHTRWATHGGVTSENAHPHVSQDGKFIVVHNGIIENAEEIHTELKSEGINFKSETDSEIIPHLLQKYYDGNIYGSIQKVMKRITGRSSIVFLTSHGSGLYFARKGLPLHVAKDSSRYYIGSDLISFPADATCFSIPERSYGCFGRDALLKDLQKQVALPMHFTSRKQINSSVSKGDYNSFMEKEMRETATVLHDTQKQDLTSVSNFCSRFRTAKRIFCVGSGTSYHAALYATNQWIPFHDNVIAHQASEPFPYTVSSEDLFVVFSQSGETADILDIVEAYSSQCVAIVNKEESTLASVSSIVFPLHVGHEQCVLATKSFLAQLLVIEMLSRGLGGTVSSGIPAPSLYDSLCSSVMPVLDSLGEHIFVLGRGESLPVAMECALKLKEGAYVHAEAVASGELKHGPLALIEPGTPVIVFPPLKRERLINAAEEIRARGGVIIGVDSIKESCYDIYIPLSVNDITSQVLAAFVLTYELSKKKGINVDYPRNLAKSVTVN